MNSPSPQLDPALRAYLAEFDVPCPTCGYNLRGLAAPDCPECGRAVPPSVMPDPADLEAQRRRTALYFRHNDVFCRRCKLNLRGREDGVCPGCGRRYAVLGPPATTPPEAAPTHLSRLGCVLSVVVMAAVVIGIAALSMWSGP